MLTQNCSGLQSTKKWSWWSYWQGGRKAGFHCIVTLPKYGHGELNIRRPHITDILRYGVRRRKNALLMRTRVEIVWDDVAVDGWILGRTSGIPRICFCRGGRGADDITKKREPGIEIIERTP